MVAITIIVFQFLTRWLTDEEVEMAWEKDGGGGGDNGGDNNNKSP